MTHQSGVSPCFFNTATHLVMTVTLLMVNKEEKYFVNSCNILYFFPAAFM